MATDPEIAGRFIDRMNDAIGNYLSTRAQQQQQQQQQVQQKAQQDQDYNDQVSTIRGAYAPVMKRLIPDLSDEEFQGMTKNPDAFKSALDLYMKYQDKLQSTQDRNDQKSTRQSEEDEKRQQDLYEKGSQRLTQVRGDNSLKSAETMRDASIQALATINHAEESNDQGIMNPTEFVDTVSQLYRAKNGSVPDSDSLKKMRQETSKGRFGYAYTYLTGNPAPATSKAVQDALKQFIMDTGEQADRLHEGYMNPRNFLNPGLKGQYRQQLEDEIKQGRGTTFKDYRAKYFKDFDSVDEALASNPKPGDILQVKGKRFKVQSQ